MLSWLLETLLGLLLAGLTVAGFYEAWQNRRSSAGLLQVSVALAAVWVGMFVISTWLWRWSVSIVEWLFNWLVPHLFKWVMEILEFLILTVVPEAVTHAWELVTNLGGNFYTLPIAIVLAVWFVYLKFSHERDRQRFRNIESNERLGNFNWGEAIRNMFRPLFRWGSILERRLKNGL